MSIRQLLQFGLKYRVKKMFKKKKTLVRPDNEILFSA